MSNKLKIGHLVKADAAKIARVPVKEGQVIFSEGHNVQFADFAGKRHTFGDIISGVYNDSYIDFNDGNITWDDTLNAIKTNGNVKDGQKLQIANTVMVYRKIGQYNFISLDDINPGSVPFIISYGGSYNIAHQTTVLLMDIINKQLYVVTVDVASNGTIQVKCEGLNGTVADLSSLVSVTLTGYLLRVKPLNSHVFDIVSFSDSNIPSLTGFYSIIDDLA